MDKQKVHILLVEDNKEHAERVCQAFESRAKSETVKVVGTLHEARACLKQAVPDLVIADFCLPDGKGIDLLDGDGRRGLYPLMLMTNQSEEQSAVEAMKAGALDYVVKTKETLAAMPHFAERALREWAAVTQRQRGLAPTKVPLDVEVTERKPPQNELSDLSCQNEFILTSAAEGIYGLDLNGNTTFVNPAAARMLGWNLEEFIGKPHHTLLHHTQPDGTTYPREKCPIDATFRNGVTHHVNHEVFWRKDGTSFPVDYTSTPMRDDQGDLIGAVITFHDITELKRAEPSLAGQKMTLEHIAMGASLPDTLMSLCRIAETYSQGMLCSILLLKGGTHLQLGAAPSLPETYTQAIEGMEIGPCEGSCGTAAYRKETVIVSDIATDPLWAQYKGLALSHGLRACWSMPILGSEGSVLGTFSMYYHETRSPNTTGLMLMDTFRWLAGIAIERKKAEEAVHTSEERYRAFYHENPSMHFTVALDGTVLSVNQCGAQQLGYTPEELLGQPVFKIVSEEDRSTVQEQFYNWLQNPSEVAHWEIRKVHKKGGILWVREAARLIHTPEGYSLVLIVCEDVTERKRAEETLRVIIEGTAAVTSSDFFHSLLRHLAIAFKADYAFIAEYLDGTTTQVRTLAFLKGNEFGENIEYTLDGTPCQEVIGGKACYYPRDVQTLFPHDRNLAELNVQSYLGLPLHDSSRKAIGHIAIMGKGSSHFDSQEMLSWVATESLLKIFVARTGTELERYRAEEALRFTQFAVDQASDAIFWAGPDERLIYVNEEACRSLGYTREELLHMSIRDFSALHNRKRSERRLTNRRTTGKIQYEAVHRTKSGGTFPAEISLNVLRHNNQEFTCAIIRDITERKGGQKKLQTAYVRLREITRRLDNVKEAERKRIARELHDEFGQTLTALKFDVSWVKRKLKGRLEVSDETQLMDKLDSMSTLADQSIQTVRRIASSLRPPLLDDLGLVPALEWQARDFQRRTGIACEFSSGLTLTQILISQEKSSAFFRITQELLTNVLRHAHASLVNIEIKEVANMLILKVHDNGIGIGKGQSSHSLGLLGMKERAASLGGDFTIWSEPGKGTTAQIQIPR